MGLQKILLKNLTIKHKSHPFEIRNNSLNILFDLFNIFKFIKIIKLNKIDSIFCYHMKPVIYGSIIATVLGIKNIYSIVTGLGYVFTKNEGIQMSLTRTLLKKLLSFSFLLITKSFFKIGTTFLSFARVKNLKAYLSLLTALA